MALIEAIMFLIGPTLEFVLPLALYLVEAIIWLCVLFFVLVKSLFKLQKPVVPSWVSLVGSRARLESVSSKWQQFRRRKSGANKNS